MVASPAQPLKALAVQNYGPSGTMLLHSLFDGHPQLLTLPGLYPIGIYSGWRAFVAGLTGPPAPDAVVGFLMNWIRPLHDVAHLEAAWGLTELGEGRDDHCCVDAGTLRAQLIDALAARPDGTRRAAVTAVFLAYARCLGRDTGRATTLVYPAHSSEIQDLRDLAEDFPDIRVIHTVRDPVDGLFSTAKHNRVWQERHDAAGTFDPFACAIEQMTADRTPLVERREPFHALRPFDRALADRCCAVRLEDVHQSPEAVLRAVASWAGFAWDSALLESTFAGKAWWNRPGLRRVSGFSDGMATTGGVGPIDRRRIAAVTAPVRRRYGYARQGPGERIGDSLALLAVVAPFAVERADRAPGRYLARRLALWRGALALRRQSEWVELLPIPAHRVAQSAVEGH